MENFLEKNKKMTLEGYYQELPEATYPKKEFINKIVAETGVSTTTVRNWITYGMKPKNEKHIEVLERITGIKREELWQA